MSCQLRHSSSQLAMISSQSPHPLSVSVVFFQRLALILLSAISANGATKLVDAAGVNPSDRHFCQYKLTHPHIKRTSHCDRRYKDHSCHFAMTKLCPEFSGSLSPSAFRCLPLGPTQYAQEARFNSSPLPFSQSTLFQAAERYQKGVC